MKWCGDMTEIPTDEGKLYLATVLDLFSRKLLASPTAEHPDAELAGDAIKMAAAVRGGRTVIDGVIFHTDRGSTYTAKDFTKLCRRLGVVQSMGRVGSVSITPPRRRSSPPSSMRCCPGIISAPAPRPALSSSPGARTSTTSNDGTARRRCWRRTSTRESLPSSRTQLKRSLQLRPCNHPHRQGSHRRAHKDRHLLTVPPQAASRSPSPTTPPRPRSPCSAATIAGRPNRRHR